MASYFKIGDHVRNRAEPNDIHRIVGIQVGKRVFLSLNGGGETIVKWNEFVTNWVLFDSERTYGS